MERSDQNALGNPDRLQPSINKMATLMSGQQYGLSSQGNSNEEKSLVFVKLTDTALRALEEYSRNKVKCNQRPTIQFLSSNGMIVLPRSNSDSPTKFGFTVSNCPETDGSFECIQQIGSRSLNSLGSIVNKMHIHATEDSYENARHRVAEVEQQSKNYGTKVIKASGPFVGRKVKLKQPISAASIPPPQASSSPSSYSFNSVLSNVSHQQQHHQHNQFPQKSLSPIAHKPTFNNSQRPSRATSDIMKRPYRERVIQLLALRPYKKPELLARLMKDGVKEKDKKSLSSVLSQVAILKDNSYDLARHIWNEVNEKWPFYSESEKQLLKRRKPQNLTPPEENQNLEPNHMSSSPNSMKRTSNSEGNPTKKQRISHYVKSDNVPKPVEPSRVKSDNILTSSYKLNYNKYNGYMKPNPSSVPPVKPHCDSNSLPPFDSASNSPFSSSRNNVFSDDNNKHSSLPRSGSCLSAFKDLHSSSTKVNSTGSSPSSSPDSLDSSDSGFTGFTKYSSDFLSKYQTIRNNSQRAEYKSDFNNEYEEYKSLYKKISEVSKTFSTLGNNLRSVSEGSEEYMQIKSQIVREYQDSKYKKQYQEAKKRFQYLHDKLAHIKQLISEYDQSRLATS